MGSKRTRIQRYLHPDRADCTLHKINLCVCHHVPGTYNASLMIDSTDPDEQHIEVPLQVSVVEQGERISKLNLMVWSVLSGHRLQQWHLPTGLSRISHLPGPYFAWHQPKHAALYS